MDTNQPLTEETVVARNPLEIDAAATQLVRKYMLGNAGVSLIPLPLLDYVAIAGMQYKMLGELAEMYGVPFNQERVKSAVTALIGSLGTGTLAAGACLSLLRIVPGLGLFSVVSVPIVSAAVTWAVGGVFIQHFASGGTFLTFNPELVREHFKSAFQDGLNEARVMTGKAKPAVTTPVVK